MRMVCQANTLLERILPFVQDPQSEPN